MKVGDLYSRLGRGLQPNRFQVTITGAPGSFSELQFLCKGAQLPSSNLGEASIPHMGRIYKVPCDRSFEDITLTVLNDQFGLIRRAFEGWQKQLNDYMENTRESDTFAECKIEQLTQTEGQPAPMTYNLKDVWPGEISAVDLDWAANDAAQEFTVTLKYQRLEIDNV
tara:strand:- start:519 stop:1019 length:501 start_codon:yes stop_codon:yes gene_type:complete